MRGRGEVVACFLRVSIIWPAIACSAFFFSFSRSLSLSFLSPLSLFRFDHIASHLRNIIWFEIQHFPLCHVLGSAAHALCRSLISIHSLLKCSSIHLERVLRLALRVERILLNERWQRPALRQQNLLYRKRLQTVSPFLLLWLGVSQRCHTHPVPPLQITYQAKPYFLLFWLALKCHIHPISAGCIILTHTPHPDASLMHKSLSCFLSSLLCSYDLLRWPSYSVHISIRIFRPRLIKTTWPFVQNPAFIPAAC